MTTERVVNLKNLLNQEQRPKTALEIKLDLRSEAGLLKSTLLHRLNLIHVPLGKLMADGPRDVSRSLGHRMGTALKWRFVLPLEG